MAAEKLAVAVCGDEDVWTFEDWKTSSCGVVYAGTTTLYGTNGGKQEFIAHAASRRTRERGTGGV